MPYTVVRDLKTLKAPATLVIPPETETPQRLALRNDPYLSAFLNAGGVVLLLEQKTLSSELPAGAAAGHRREELLRPGDSDPSGFRRAFRPEFRHLEQSGFRLCRFELFPAVHRKCARRQGAESRQPERRHGAARRHSRQRASDRVAAECVRGRAAGQLGPRATCAICSAMRPEPPSSGRRRGRWSPPPTPGYKVNPARLEPVDLAPYANRGFPTNSTMTARAAGLTRGRTTSA